MALAKDYELSYLASDLSNYARNRAQTWCAIGNACSLQHETEAALRCFRRAAQIEQIGAGNVSPGGSGNTGMTMVALMALVKAVDQVRVE